MSSLDGFDGANFPNSKAAASPARGVNSHLVETLIFVLIEKGILTKNDALSLIQTVAEVKRGEVDDDGGTSPETAADLKLLHRLYASFEVLEERPGVVTADGAKVHRLRRPVHGDRPRFPHDD
jgi:hypothetical protein